MLIKITMISIFIIIDQFTKFLVARKLSLNQSINIVSHYLKITSIRNKGAALGIFEGQRSLFIIIPLVVLTVFSYLLIKEVHIILILVYVLIISGTCGNLIDRIFRKSVIDFIDLTLFGYNLPIFNFADLFLALGFIGFLFNDIF